MGSNARLGNGTLILLFRNCAYRTISRIERLLAPLPLVNLHSPVQRNLPRPPISSDNLANRSPPTPSSHHLVIQVRIVQLQGVPLAGWVKLQRKQLGALALSTSLPSRPSSLPLVALAHLINLNSLRIPAYLGALMHLHLKINPWAGLVCLIVSALIVNLPCHRQSWGLCKWY
jgi:hypothetical protein